MNWEVRTMQSKILSFNPTLFRKNLTRFWPLWGLASFIGALFPLALMLGMLRGAGPESAAEFSSLYYGVASYALPVLSLFYAILCAMAVWSYLYSARSVGLMHTLPIRREGLFLTNFLSGMAMMLIPYAVTGLLAVGVSLIYGYFDPTTVAVTILAVLGESFFYFASATFVAFVTGNIFALPALYFLLHFLAAILDWLVSLFAQGFIFGFNGNYTGAAEWLSPTLCLLHNVNAEDTYTEIQRMAPGGGTYMDHVLTDVSLSGFWIIGVYVLVGIALLAAALGLYRRRRSENAGDVVAVGALRPVFRYGVAALAALLGGQLLYELFWYQFQAGSYYDTVPMTICLLVAGIIGYYAASMLLAKSLRVFQGSWKGLLAVAAGCVLVCCALHFDVLGIGARVPEAGAVQSVDLDVAGNIYHLYPGEDDGLIEEVRALHQAIIADEDYIQETGADWTFDTEQTAGSAWMSVWLTYHLSGGGAVQRYYGLPLTRARMDTADTYDNLLDRLVNGDAMKAERLHLNDDRYTVTGGDLYVENQNLGYDLSDREASAILEAVGRDLESGSWGTYDWFDETEGSNYAISLSLRFEYSLDDRSQGTDWINITLWPAMMETTACLLDLGLVTEADLVTYKELYPADYADPIETAPTYLEGGEVLYAAASASAP